MCMNMPRFRIVKSMMMWPHGIMVCTIGSLQRTLRRFPDLRSIIVDVVLDECSQVWANDAMLFLPQFPNLMRLAIFGDPRQQTPHVIKLMKVDVYFDAVASVLPKPKGGTHQSPFTTFQERLRVQYRTLPEMCEVHAPLFYDYPIISFRQTPHNPEHDGLYFERLPFGWELQGQSLYDYEVQRALDIYMEVREKNLRTRDGDPYSIVVVVPYLNNLDTVCGAAAERGLDDFEAVSYDSVQGKEYNVVIVMTCRQKAVDLVKCRHRGNVVTSRQKDMLILMMHYHMALGTHEGALRFWGGFVLHARPYSPSDACALRVRAKLVLYESKREGKDSKIMHMGEAVCAIMRRHRSLYPMQSMKVVLFLKRVPSANTAADKRLYHAVLNCSRSTFRRIRRICERLGSDMEERNDHVASVLQSTLNIASDDEIELSVKNAYTCH